MKPLVKSQEKTWDIVQEFDTYEDGDRHYYDREDVGTETWHYRDTVMIAGGDYPVIREKKNENYDWNMSGTAYHYNNRGDVVESNSYNI